MIKCWLVDVKVWFDYFFFFVGTVLVVLGRSYVVINGRVVGK